MRSGKRTLEELVNKSDSDDEDYSDSPAPRRSKSSPRKKTGPAKKRRRRDSNNDIVSDGFDLSEEDLSFDESEPETDDPNAPRNARGTARRRTTQSRPMYEEVSDEEVSLGDEDADADADADADEDGPVASPSPKKSNIVTLKLNPKILQQPQFMATRRITRRTRGASEDIYALTNSGRHMETIERGTLSPEAEVSRRNSRGRRSSKQPAMSEVMETTLEVMESAPQSFAEGDALAVNGTEDNQGDVDMANDDGIVPESENGDAKVENDDDGDEDGDDEGPITRRRSRPTRNQPADEEEAEPEETQRRRSSRKKPSSQRKNEESDFEPDEEVSNGDESEDSQSAKSSPRKASQVRDEEEDSTAGRRAGLRKRPSRAQSEVAEELAEELEDLRGGRPRRRMAQEIIYEKPRRNRKDVDYRIIRPDLTLNADDGENDLVIESPSRRGRRGGGGISWERTLFSTAGPFGGGGSGILGPRDTPAAAMGGMDSDSSDDEVSQPHHSMGSELAPGGLVPQANAGDHAQNTSGMPANFGRVKEKNKNAPADVDPLGVDPDIKFDSVGGVDNFIFDLKEMVKIPKQYPEVFQKLNVKPPRGVLFHGPPGTGKTLLARALANSLSSEGRKVTFYMRKGADVLSKWVGEAERQLRLLFEEAYKTQPSVIFFDEFDGLAPVRSSKQEQIHSSIVTTLLSLMDGMGDRGEVMLIGATNRPDSIDDAFRRPGRFDREFRFELPDDKARLKILEIHTKAWDYQLDDKLKSQLVSQTKGYGGADLQGLSTQAALNAIQRTYPQIYKSDKKLIIDPKKITVEYGDFKKALAKIVPSSQRSSSSSTAALSEHLEPLLRRALADIKTLLSKILPQRKKLTALEEAEYEQPAGGNVMQREQIMEDFDRLRVFRPRLLLRGPHGMGQQNLGAALLHHFQGLYVQVLDAQTILGDERGPATAVIHLFSEVKRNKPSVIYIPDLDDWPDLLASTPVLSLFPSLLRSIPATDPVLLLGVTNFTEDEEDEAHTALLKALFGFSKKNLFNLQCPDHTARHEFFGKIIEYIKTPPTDLPDPENRKLRVLPELEVAPPPPPEPEVQMTKEQVKAQKKKDRQILNLLKIRIQPIMDQIKKYKRFRAGVIDEAQIRYLWEEADPNIVTSDVPAENSHILRPFEKDYDKHGVPGLRETVSGKFYYNMEIVTVEQRLSNGYYKRPCEFLADIKRIEKDAGQLGDQDRLIRARQLLNNVEVDISTIEQAEPALMAECENIHLREVAREKKAAERAKLTAEQKAASRPDSANGHHGNVESKVLSDYDARPVTPTKLSNVISINGDHNGGGSDLNESGTHGQSNGSHGDGDGDVFMTNSEDHSGSKDTQNSSFGPSAQPKPAYSHTAPSQQLRRESGLSSFSQKGPMTPMAPGSQPADYSNEASTTQTTSDKKSSEQSTNPQYQTQSPQVSRHEYPDLTQYPDRVSQEDHLPDTQQGGSSQPSPLPRDSQALTQVDDHSGFSGSHSQSQPKPQPPLFDASTKSAANASANLQSLLNSEPTPELVIDHEYIENLHVKLTQQTSGCSVEQLEQINAQLMGYLLETCRKWNRTTVAKGVSETFNETLEDMQSMQDIGPISHHTKQQLADQQY